MSAYWLYFNYLLTWWIHSIQKHTFQNSHMTNDGFYLQRFEQVSPLQWSQCAWSAKSDPQQEASLPGASRSGQVEPWKCSRWVCGLLYPSVSQAHHACLQGDGVVSGGIYFRGLLWLQQEESLGKWERFCFGQSRQIKRSIICVSMCTGLILNSQFYSVLWQFSFFFILWQKFHLTQKRIIFFADNTKLFEYKEITDRKKISFK